MSTRCGHEADIATSQWRAVEVDKVDEVKLMDSMVRGVDLTTTLPTCSITLPPANFNSVCILSWRWDIASCVQARPSKNLLCAFHLAKRLKYRYLLVDFISIDQSLTQLGNGELSQQIVLFSELFRRLPVIAAYDEEINPRWDSQDTADWDYGYLYSTRSQFLRILKRPWILREIQCFQHNPIGVAYAGHSTKGGTMIESDESRTRAEQWIPAMYERTFARSAVGVLCGNISMTSISDFRYILPDDGDLLARAYDRWRRNDYLLTVALLSLLQSQDTDVDGGNDPSDIMQGLEAYNFQYDEQYRHSSSREAYNVYLNGTKLAHWYYKDNDYGRTKQSRITVDRLARVTISAALEIPCNDSNDMTETILTTCTCSQPAKIKSYHIDLEQGDQ